MYKVIYHNKDKGVEWVLSTSGLRLLRDTEIKPYVYILPTIVVEQELFPSDEDDYIGLVFRWLVFSIGITKFFGTEYKN